jgi:hypothetical protein
MGRPHSHLKSAILACDTQAQIPNMEDVNMLGNMGNELRWHGPEIAVAIVHGECDFTLERREHELHHGFRKQSEIPVPFPFAARAPSLPPPLQGFPYEPKFWRATA